MKLALGGVNRAVAAPKPAGSLRAMCPSYRAVSNEAKQ